MTLPIDVLSYEDLRAKAEEFTSLHNSARLIPVAIEEIAEFKLGIAFDIKACLRESCDVDAFISADCSVIYIDSGVWLSPNSNRLRFSIAHEVAHSILHRQVLSVLQFSNMPEWREAYETIPEKEYGWLEWQANALAGLILVPQAELEREFSKTCGKYGISPAGVDEPMKYVIASEIARTFCVSSDVIEIRMAKDGLGRTK